jgi:hypothetical protein
VDVKPSSPLIDAEKHCRSALQGLSVLCQLSERLSLPIAKPLLEEPLALTRAQRRALKAAHLQLEADPFWAHLLESRVRYRKEVEHPSKSGRRLEEFGRESYFLAQSLGFRGEFHEWRGLLAIIPRH